MTKSRLCWKRSNGAAKNHWHLAETLVMPRAVPFLGEVGLKHGANGEGWRFYLRKGSKGSKKRMWSL